MGKVIIIDLVIPNKIHEWFGQLGLIVVDAQEMTKQILNSREDFWQQFDAATTLLVFPGNGANIVKSYISKEWLRKWKWESVYAKRYWIPGEDPWVVVGRIFSKRMIIGIKDVVVIDDVISSGRTARLLRLKNMPWIPGANWHLAVWVAQKSACLKGYSLCCFVEEFGTKDKKVPINSLSTLLESSEIAASYTSRHFADNGGFNTALRECRKYLNS